MTVITISREYGTLGDEIAQGVADQMNMPVADKATFRNLLAEYGLINFTDFYETEHSMLDRFVQSNQDVISVLNEGIKGYAKDDNVIIRGRGGFAILQNYSNVLNVLIQEPLETRAWKHIQKTEVYVDEDAVQFVKEKDNVRTSFLHTYYGVKQVEAGMFDLVIDSSIIPVDLAVKWICEMAEYLKDNPQTRMPSTQTIEVDPIMLDAVRKQLQK